MSNKLTPIRQRDLLARLAEVLIGAGISIEEAAAGFQRALLEAALERAGGSQMEAAKQQGMPRNTLRNQMMACGLLRRPRIQVNDTGGEI